MSGDVWAIKNGKRRRFTRAAWDLLGKNKEGWEALPDVTIENIADKTTLTKPATGQKQPIVKPVKQVIENVASKEPAQTVDNIAKVVEDGTQAGETSEQGKNEASTETISAQQKEVFAKAAKGINKGAIKDFFDKQEPPVGYENGWDVKRLVEQLGNHLNWSIVELQKAFN
jgi:hypothetical protein